MKSVTTTSNLITERRKLENKIGEQDLRITIEKKVEKKIKMKRILFKIQMQKIFLKNLLEELYLFIECKVKELKKIERGKRGKKWIRDMLQEEKNYKKKKLEYRKEDKESFN